MLASYSSASGPSSAPLTATCAPPVLAWVATWAAVCMAIICLIASLNLAFSSLLNLLVLIARP